MTDTYNGWANRETWALQLWLMNDQGLYEMTRERVTELVREADDDDDPRSWLEAHGAGEAGEAIKELWGELTDPRGDFAPLSPEFIDVIKDIGSEYRIDWDEIGAAWLEDVTS